MPNAPLFAANALSPPTATATSLRLIVTASSETKRCGRPASIGAMPTATDCLFILNAAVGIGGCAPTCACNVNGDESDDLLLGAGAAYLFGRVGETWTQEKYIKSSNTAVQDNFGNVVAIEGTTVAIGAYKEDSSATTVDGEQTNDADPGAGAVYLFDQ